MTSLDCLVLGYNDDTEATFARLEVAPADSVEKRVFLRNHVRINSAPLTYLDALNECRTPTSHQNRPLYHVGEVSNLAAVYLTAFLRRGGYAVEQVGMPLLEQALLAATLRTTPKTVAITTTFYEDTSPVVELVKLVKRESPGTMTIVGGPLVQNILAEPALVRDEALRAIGANIYVDESQGEATLAAVVGAVAAGTSLVAIPNLFIKVARGYEYTTRRAEDNDLDECAIDWGQFSADVLGATVQTRTARSCAYSCSFCDYPQRAGRLRLASVETVERELAVLHARGVRNIVFVDDTFNVPHHRFRAICEMMLRRRFNFNWFSYFRCGAVPDDGTYDLMKASGCTGVFLGIESGDSNVLRNMDKAASVAGYERGIEELNARNILTFASFICGFPGETERSINNTIRLINNSGPTLFRVEPWWYNHQSPISRRRDDFGLEGRGYSWRHDTMSASEACDGIEYICANVKSSWWCPQQSFSFWAVPYLLGKGMTMSQVVEFHRLCQPLLGVYYYSRPDPAQDESVQALRTFTASVALTAPRFTLPPAMTGIGA